VLMYTLYVV